MKRAIRRHYVALIKNKVRREVEEINEYFNRDTWNSKSLETRRERAIRAAYRDKGRGYVCDCGWCLNNLLIASVREISRVEDEEKDFLAMGCPPDWGYDWKDIWEDMWEDDDIWNPELDW